MNNKNGLPNKAKTINDSKSEKTMATVSLVLAILAAVIYFVLSYLLPVCVGAVCLLITAVLLIIVYIGWMVLVFTAELLAVLSPVLIPLIGIVYLIVNCATVLLAILALILAVSALNSAKKRGSKKTLPMTALIFSVASLSSILLGILFSLAVAAIIVTVIAALFIITAIMAV